MPAVNVTTKRTARSLAALMLFDGVVERHIRRHNNKQTSTEHQVSDNKSRERAQAYASGDAGFDSALLFWLSSTDASVVLTSSSSTIADALERDASRGMVVGV